MSPFLARNMRKEVDIASLVIAQSTYGKTFYASLAQSCLLYSVFFYPEPKLLTVIVFHYALRLW